ncbi:hypothetical protein Tco_0852784 [Tanacetum coccineum]
MKGCPYNLKIPCNIGHMHIEKAYINLNSPLNIMTRMDGTTGYEEEKLNPREDANGGISNFTGRIKGIHVFVGNFTYVIDFMIVEDISSILDPRMPRTIPRLKNFNWSKVSPLLELSQNDLMNRFRHPYEKNKFMYKNCLNLGPEYQVDENMKEWLIRGHVSVHETT